MSDQDNGSRPYSPQGKSFRFSQQLKNGYDGGGEELSAAKKAYRSGYIARGRDDAELYHYKQDSNIEKDGKAGYEKYADGLNRKAVRKESNAKYYNEKGDNITAEKRLSAAKRLRTRAKEILRKKTVKKDK
ncbi:MAG: hypothetical protein LBT30_07525 [Clostridiales bacterium]|jgi:hypothetical protein|nr:hypothetical protein [Clostridiales bacterium]